MSQETNYEDGPGSIVVTDDFRFLAEASARLASSLDYEATLQNVAEQMTCNRCDISCVYLREGDTFRMAAWRSSDPAKSELAERLLRDELTDGFLEVVQGVVDENRSLVIEEVDDAALDSMRTEESRRALVRELGVESVLLSPLVTHGNSIGFLACLSLSAERRYSDKDLPLFEELARRAATAVDHARLFTRLKRAEEAQRFLNQASVTLAASLDYETTLTNVAEVLVPHLADWIVIHLLEEGAPRRVAVAHVDPEKVRWAEEMGNRYPTDMESPNGLGRVLREGVPEYYSVVTHEMLEAGAIDEEHLEVIRKVDVGSVLMVPMQSRDQVVGAITFVSSQQGRYTQGDLEFASELAYRAAIAVDNARLFRSVEQIVTERTQQLKAVNKELEAFAYSVSHDLRAPLRSIMSASMIVIEDFGEVIGEEGRSELRRASAAAKRMSGLIDDLLEYSRLGRREMNRSDVDMSAVARTIGRELDLPEGVLEVQPEMEVDADPALLRVLLTNHIENAWKFAKEKPQPKITVGEENGAYFVRDNGVGFDEQFATKLYVPFERLHSPQDYPGTGIGLANIKRIVSRHNGNVWATGQVGEGATFYFTFGKADQP